MGLGSEDDGEVDGTAGIGAGVEADGNADKGVGVRTDGWCRF